MLLFRKWLETKGVYGEIIREPITNDSFIHITTQERAVEIIKSGRLLMRPPHPKFGTDTADAISVNHGIWLPSVQSTHIKGGNLVAVLFKTDILPYAGYPEEVKWNKDVILKNPQIIPLEKAQSLFHQSKKEDFEIEYF